MIISVSGYAGSGKDTVGELIQSIEPSFKIKKFADKLKTIASILTGIPKEKFEDQEFKKTNLSSEWNRYLPFSETQIETPMTVREFLQKLGTDAIRNGLHDRTWLNAMYTDYQLQYERFHPSELLEDHDFIPKKEYPNWVITDARFINELQSAKDHRGITIRVNRPGVGPISNHPSETEQDTWTYDYTIENNGSISDLKEKVNEILNGTKEK